MPSHRGPVGGPDLLLAKPGVLGSGAVDEIVVCAKPSGEESLN